MESTKTERKYKDKLFRMVFREKEELLSLYNAVNKSNYTNSEELEIVTLENAIYMNMKNDLAFLIDDCMNLYEHQSTVNLNMPLRNLIYVAKEYRKLVAEETLYDAERIMLPVPKFVVFYNGTTKQPESQMLKLSDSYLGDKSEIELELKVTVLNINEGYNAELLEACQTLKEYSLYVKKVRDYAKRMDLEDAVDNAIDESIKENILKKFLVKYRAEARAVSIFEYDEEREMALIKKSMLRAARKEVRDEVIAEVRKEVREEMQEEVRKEVREKIQEEVYLTNLIENVYKKVQKGKAIEVIADELEMELDTLISIYEAVVAIKDNFDMEVAYKQITRLEE